MRYISIWDLEFSILIIFYNGQITTGYGHWNLRPMLPFAIWICLPRNIYHFLETSSCNILCQTFNAPLKYYGPGKVKNKLIQQVGEKGNFDFAWHKISQMKLWKLATRVNEWWVLYFYFLWLTDQDVMRAALPWQQNYNVVIFYTIFEFIIEICTIHLVWESIFVLMQWNLRILSQCMCTK